MKRIVALTLLVVSLLVSSVSAYAATTEELEERIELLEETIKKLESRISILETLIASGNIGSTDIVEEKTVEEKTIPSDQQDLYDAFSYVYSMIINKSINSREIEFYSISGKHVLDQNEDKDTYLFYADYTSPNQFGANVQTANYYAIIIYADGSDPSYVGGINTFYTKPGTIIDLDPDLIYPNPEWLN